MSSFTLQIIPNFAAVFKVPIPFLNAFIEHHDCDDFQSGVDQFLCYADSYIEPFLDKIGIEDEDDAMVSCDKIGDSYIIRVSKERDIDWDDIPAQIETTNFSELLDKKSNMPILYALQEPENIIDIVNLLLNIKWVGEIEFFLYNNETFLYIPEVNSQKIDFLLCEFTNPIKEDCGITLQSFCDMSNMVLTFKINGIGGEFECINMGVKKGFTKRQKVQLKKAFHKLKGFIQDIK